MLKLLDNHLTTILLVALAGFFLFGMGYMINQDTKRTEARYAICIEAGKQYIQGSCVE